MSAVHEEIGSVPPLHLTMGFIPNDLASDLGATPLSVWLDDGRGGGVSTPALSSLATTIRLVTYPERLPVPFDVDVLPARGVPQPAPALVPKGTVVNTRSIDANPGRAALRIRPKSALGARWYELSASSAAVTNVEGKTVTTPDGLRAVRFRPDHGPVLSGVSIVSVRQTAPSRVIELPRSLVV